MAAGIGSAPAFMEEEEEEEDGEEDPWQTFAFAKLWRQ